MKVKVKEEIEVVCQNRKARHEYFVLETLECGIVLVGSEIKSIRDHKVSLDASYALIEKDEVWLVDCNIDPYPNARMFPHEPKRRRKLLLHRDQIRKFAEKAGEKGHTLIPLRLYLKDGRCKVELAVCKGKQLHDKRATQKERDTKKEIRNY